MRVKWAMLVVLVCLALAVAVTACAAAQERPTERVSPAPEVNFNAVVWRTPEPPASPQAGDVWVNPRDGMEMVYVAAGEFTFGSSDAELDALLRQHPQLERSWFEDEQPQCRVNLPAYWIGRTEVTNAQYLRFVQTTGQRAPEHWEGGRPPAGLESFPVVYVNWQEARAYCEWAGGRLPTEPEWEKAARGTDGRIFPWGNEWDRAKCRNFEDLTGRSYASFREWESAVQVWLRGHDVVREGAAAVGSYPSGASPYGCQDMAGNVWEWCEDWYNYGAYRRYARGDLTLPTAGDRMVRRGGSCCYGFPQFFRCAYRSNSEPGLRYDFHGGLYGFRCLRGLP
jgi:formylglycine-generating enzyme required for sulfatase activity